MSGQRRLQAVSLNEALGFGLPNIRALVAPPDTSVETLRTVAAHENLRRDRVSAQEMALLAHQLQRKGTAMERIADQLGTSMETSGSRSRGPYRVTITLRTRGDLERLAAWVGDW